MKRGAISRRAIKAHLKRAGFKKTLSMESFPGVEVFQHVDKDESDYVTVTLGALDKKTGDFSCCLQLEGDVVEPWQTKISMELWLGAPTKQQLLFLFDDLWRMFFFSFCMRFHVLYNWGYHKHPDRKPWEPPCE